MVDHGYSSINAAQVKYFNWLAEANKQKNGGEYTSSMAFLHKPIIEFFGYESGLPEESIYHALKDNGLTDMVCGHFHEINETHEHFGVNFTFACKTGELVYYYDDGVNNLNGGTTFTLRDNDVVIENHYVDRDMFHINGSDNIYND